jgi:hypothetical protein
MILYIIVIGFFIWNYYYQLKLLQIIDFSTCDLNILSKQIYLLRCFIPLLHYSMQDFDTFQGEWKVAACCTHGLKTLKTKNIVLFIKIDVHIYKVV